MKLTIVADSPDGPVPIDRMVTGQNWVGYQLIGHFALHAGFVDRNQPVSRILFLDQPSQVYFTLENDTDGSIPTLSENDRDAVLPMFQVVFDSVNELVPHFQVVITEHADTNED